MGVGSNVFPQLSSQPLIGKVFRVNNTTKGVDEKMVVVPITKAPFQFIQVPVKVLGTDLVSSR